MALLVIELVESFTILDTLIDCEFPLTHDYALIVSASIL